MAREKIAAINIRVEPWIKEAAERAAKADRRSLTTFIEKLIEDYLREHGHLSGNSRPAGKSRK